MVLDIAGNALQTPSAPHSLTSLVRIGAQVRPDAATVTRFGFNFDTGCKLDKEFLGSENSKWLNELRGTTNENQ
eukprot:133258-Amphidinium_carterae.1